jgi:SpoVK/Ycf46/Vps4 family AAA+-type ATPase
MKDYIEMQIPQSSSVHLSEVLDLCKEMVKKEINIDKDGLYRLKIYRDDLVDQFNKFEIILNIAKNWKGFQIRYDGKQIDNKEIHKIYNVSRCINARAKYVNPEKYCQKTEIDGWGCFRLTNIRNGLPSKNDSFHMMHYYWFYYGEFNDDFSKWVINKEMIKQELLKFAETNLICTCPFFRQIEIERNLSLLPDIIDINSDDSWQVILKETLIGDKIRNVPQYIIPSYIDSGKGLTLAIPLENKNEEIEDQRIVPNVRFSDVGGLDDILEKIREVIELPLKQPDLVKYLGIVPHKGVLLYGPPGCGKTMIAKAIANEVNAHFISIGGPELLSQWHGQSEANLREIFKTAKEKSPSIIFFDEFDSISQSRTNHESDRVRSTFVNQLLTLLDGVEIYENICVIASTNRPELIDSAVLRPGRFDYLLEIPFPDREGCSSIFKIHTKRLPVSKNINIDSIIDNLLGKSGADIAFIAREAAYICLRRHFNILNLLNNEVLNHSQISQIIITQKDFEKAIKTHDERQIGNK